MRSRARRVTGRSVGEQTAQAFVVTGPSAFEVRTFPLPALGEDDALLQVLAAGVDGSDVAYLAGRSARRIGHPFIAGDEIVGRIVALGAAAGRRWGVAEGDVVAVEPHLSCGACRWCGRGRPQFCEAGLGFGARMSCAAPPHLWGAFAEYLYLPRSATVAPLGDLPVEVAILIPSMLANGVRWVSAVGGVRPGDRVAILGAGQQALGCTLVAAEVGADDVIVCGLPGDEDRLATAARLGATETVIGPPAVRGADVVIDVTGSASGLPTALELVGRGGRIVLAGLSRAPAELVPDRLVWDEVAVLGVYSHDRDAFLRAVRLARARRDVLAGVVSHRYGLADAAEAVASLTCAPRPVKVVVEP